MIEQAGPAQVPVSAEARAGAFGMALVSSAAPRQAVAGTSMRLCLASLHPRMLSGQIDGLIGLGRTLEGRGHRVSLAAPFDTSRLLSASLSDLDTGPKGLLFAARGMLHVVPTVIRAAAGCDLIHLFLPTPAFGWVADLVQANVPVPVVAGFEGHLADARMLLAARRRPSALRTDFPLWAINNGLPARLGPHRAAAYLVSSSYQERELVSLGFPAERIHVLPNLVDRARLGVSDPRLARRVLGVPDDGPAVGYLGHFNDIKGADDLATAFAGLSARRPDARLVLAWSGQGDPRPIRRELSGVASRVTWLGKVHVGTFLSAVDALALPYRSTAGQSVYPALVLEALDAGCPLVTTDLPLLREITSLGPVALSSPPERPDLLSSQVEELLSSASLRRAMSQAQRRVSASHFSPRVLVGQYEGLYERVLGAPVRRAQAA